MSSSALPPTLPPEILDLIVDHLRDERTSLNACCAVSKSWVSRARRHLFFDVQFAPQSPIPSWVKAFPDPSNSPAPHTRVLSLFNSTAVTAASTYAFAWIRSFCHITELRLDTSLSYDNRVSFAQLHGLSPTLKSLLIYCSSVPLSEVFSLICSFPLLEDLRLRLATRDNTASDGWEAPLTSPKLTGTLQQSGEIRSTSRRLLGLPSGLHFSKIVVRCRAVDVDFAKDLVMKCSDTLESLCIEYISSDTYSILILPPTDLSKAMKLEHAEFYLHAPSVRWIVTTLRTVKSTRLRQISIHSRITFVSPVGQTALKHWWDLDRLLVQFWISHSIRPKFTLPKSGGRADLGDFVQSLLPELTSRGVVDLVGVPL